MNINKTIRKRTTLLSKSICNFATKHKIFALVVAALALFFSTLVMPKMAFAGTSVTAWCEGSCSGSAYTASADGDCSAWCNGTSGGTASAWITSASFSGAGSYTVGPTLEANITKTITYSATSDNGSNASVDPSSQTIYGGGYVTFEVSATVRAKRTQTITLEYQSWEVYIAPDVEQSTITEGHSAASSFTVTAPGPYYSSGTDTPYAWITSPTTATCSFTAYGLYSAWTDCSYISAYIGTPSSSWQQGTIYSGGEDYWEGLDPDTPYHFWYQPQGASSSSCPWSNWIVGRPIPITGLDIKYNSDSSISLSWSNHPEELRPYETIHIYRRDKDTQGNMGGWVRIDSISGSNSSYTDSTTYQGHYYEYKVSVSNARDECACSNVVGTDTRPLPITGLTNTRNTDNQNTLTWTIGSENTTGYIIYRSVDDGAYEPVSEILSRTVSVQDFSSKETWIDTNTTLNHYYKYRVYTLNSIANKVGATISYSNNYTVSVLDVITDSNYTYNTPKKIENFEGSYTSGVTTLTWYNYAITDENVIVERSYDQKTWSPISTKFDDGTDPHYKDLGFNNDEADSGITITGYPIYTIYYRLTIQGRDYRDDIPSGYSETTLWQYSDIIAVTPSYVEHAPEFSVEWQDPENPYVGYFINYNVKNYSSELLYYEVFTTEESYISPNKYSMIEYATIASTYDYTAPVEHDLYYQFQDEDEDANKYVQITVYADPAHTIILNHGQTKLHDPENSTQYGSIKIKPIVINGHNSTFLNVNKDFTVGVSGTYGAQEDFGYPNFERSPLIYKFYVCDTNGARGTLAQELTSPTFKVPEDAYGKYIRYEIYDREDWFTPYESGYFGPVDTLMSSEITGSPILGHEMTGVIESDFAHYYYQWTLSDSAESDTHSINLSSMIEVSKELSGETEDKKTDTSTVESLPIYANLSEYSIEELETIANDLATNGENSEAYALFKGFMDSDARWTVYLNNGTKAEFRIIGIMHDSSTDGQTGLTLQATTSWGNYQMDSVKQLNQGGWANSTLRDMMNAGGDDSTLWNLLPEELQNAIAIVQKKTNSVSGTATSGMTTVSDQLFLASSSEMIGNYTSEYGWMSSEGTQYEFWKEKGVSSSSLSLLGSSVSTDGSAPFATRSCYPGSKTAFVGFTGTSISQNEPDTATPILPCFAIGSAKSGAADDGSSTQDDGAKDNPKASENILPAVQLDKKEYEGKYVWLTVYRDAEGTDIVSQSNLYSPIVKTQIASPVYNIDYLVGGKAQITSMVSLTDYPNADIHYRWMLYDPETTQDYLGIEDQDYTFVASDYGHSVYLVVYDANELYSDCTTYSDMFINMKTVGAMTFLNDITFLTEYPQTGDELSVMAATNLDRFYLRWYANDDPELLIEDEATPLDDLYVSNDNEALRESDLLRYYRDNIVITDASIVNRYIWVALYADEACTQRLDAVHTVDTLHKKDLTYTVIGVPAEMNKTLTVRVSTDEYPECDLKFVWKYQDDTNVESDSSATISSDLANWTNSIKPGSSMFNKSLYCTIEDKSGLYNGVVTETYGPIGANTTVDIIGEPVLGSTLQALVNTELENYVIEWTIDGVLFGEEEYFPLDSVAYNDTYVRCRVYLDGSKQDLLAEKTIARPVYQRTLAIPLNTKSSALVGSNWTIDTPLDEYAAGYNGAAISYIWYRWDENTGSQLIQRSQSYQYTAEDIGTYIYFTVEDANGLYTANSSQYFGPIGTDSTLRFENVARLGENLIATFERSDNDTSPFYYQWKVSSSTDLSSSQDIAGETGYISSSETSPSLGLRLQNANLGNRYIWLCLYSDAECTDMIASTRTVNPIEYNSIDPSLLTIDTHKGLEVYSQISASSTQAFSEYSNIKWRWVTTTNPNYVDNITFVGEGSRYEVAATDYNAYLRLCITDENGLYETYYSEAYGPLATKSTMSIDGDPHLGATLEGSIKTYSDYFYYAFIATPDGTEPTFTGATREMSFSERKKKEIASAYVEAGDDGIIGTDDDVVHDAEYTEIVEEKQLDAPVPTGTSYVMDAGIVDKSTWEGDTSIIQIYHNLLNHADVGYHVWFVCSSTVNFADGTIFGALDYGEVYKKQMSPVIESPDLVIGSTLTATSSDYPWAENTIQWYRYESLSEVLDGEGEPYLEQRPGDEGYGTYQIQQDDLGCYFKISYIDEADYYIKGTSNYYGPVVDAVTIELTGQPYLAETIDGKITNNTRKGAGSDTVYYRWMISDDSEEPGLSAIQIGKVYSTNRVNFSVSISLDDPVVYDKYLWFAAYSDAECKELISAECLRNAKGNPVPIDKQNLGTPKIEGTPRVYETLTATMVDESKYDAAYISYNWQVKDTGHGGWRYVARGTKTFVPTEEEQGLEIRVEAVDNNYLYNSSYSQSAGIVLPSSACAVYEFSGVPFVNNTLVCTLTYLYQFCPNGEKILFASDSGTITEDTFDINSVDILVREGYSASVLSDTQMMFLRADKDLEGKYIYGAVYDPERKMYCVCPSPVCISANPEIESTMYINDLATATYAFAPDQSVEELYYVWYKSDTEGNIEIVKNGTTNEFTIDGGLVRGNVNLTISEDMYDCRIGFTVSCCPITDPEIGHGGTALTTEYVKKRPDYSEVSMTTFYLDKGDITITPTKVSGYNEIGQEITYGYINPYGYKICQTDDSAVITNHRVYVETQTDTSLPILLDGINVDIADAGVITPVFYVAENTYVKLYGSAGTQNFLGTEVPQMSALYNDGHIDIVEGDFSLTSSDKITSRTEELPAIDHSNDKVYALYTSDGKLVSCDATGTPDGMYTYKTSAASDARKSQITNIFIDSEVTVIGDYAFYGCYAVESISIPEYVTSIGQYAFADMRSLQEIEIPIRVSSIGAYAFSNCQTLSKVVLGSSVDNIGSYAFVQCHNLTVAILHGTEVKNHAGNAFSESGIVSNSGAIYVDDTDIQTKYKESDAWAAYKDHIYVYGKTKKLITYASDDGTYVIADAFDATGSWTGTLTTETPYLIQRAKKYIYALSYSANKGTGAPISQSMMSKASSVSVTVSSTIPTRSYYDFLGWGNTPETKTASYNAGDSIVLNSLNPNKKIYAIWTPTNYTIAYNLDGGTVSSANPTQYNIETETFVLTNPTKIGYTFAGWSGTDISAAATDVEIETGSHGNRSYTATWSANTYTLTRMTDTISSSNKVYGTQYTSSDLSAPTKTGYTFNGWFADATLTKSIDSSKTFTIDSANFDDVSTAGTVARIYPKFTANKYTVAYNANGGSGTTMASTTMTYDTTAQLSTNTYTRAGYTFVGWSKASNATTATYYDKASVSNLATSGTVTLYAVWKSSERTITLNELKDILSDSDNQVKEMESYAQNAKLHLEVPMADGTTKTATLIEHNDAGLTFMMDTNVTTMAVNSSGATANNTFGETKLYTALQSGGSVYSLFDSSFLNMITPQDIKVASVYDETDIALTTLSNQKLWLLTVYDIYGDDYEPGYTAGSSAEATFGHQFEGWENYTAGQSGSFWLRSADYNFNSFWLYGDDGSVDDDIISTDRGVRPCFTCEWWDASLAI